MRADWRTVYAKTIMLDNNCRQLCTLETRTDLSIQLVHQSQNSIHLNWWSARTCKVHWRSGQWSLESPGKVGVFASFCSFPSQSLAGAPSSSTGSLLEVCAPMKTSTGSVRSATRRATCSSSTPRPPPAGRAREWAWRRRVNYCCGAPLAPH